MLIKKTTGDRIFDCFNTLFMILVMIVTIYPLLYVAFASLSDGVQLMAHAGALYKPLGFTLAAYKAVFSNIYILTGYRNTLFIVIAGLAVNLSLTSLGAYALSRKSLKFRKPIMLFIIFTMYFSGGLIPSYLLVKGIGLYNSLWALIIPGSINTFNLILMRTAFEAIPASLEESAKIDGAGDFTVLLRIIIPLSLPTIAVMTLYYGVGHWNAWFNAMIYLRDKVKYPLQLILREILIQNETASMMGDIDTTDQGNVAESIKFATIIVATLPILCIYPFLQKYFVKGAMIGAIKG
ncbi:MAG: carbohydrate ABC transporter permease [Clostridiaceae bacterium]